MNAGLVLVCYGMIYAIREQAWILHRYTIGDRLQNITVARFAEMHEIEQNLFRVSFYIMSSRNSYPNGTGNCRLVVVFRAYIFLGLVNISLSTTGILLSLMVS